VNRADPLDAVFHPDLEHVTIDQAFRPLQHSENPLPDDDDYLPTVRLANDEGLASLRL
jgi:hypothetical protein